MSAPLHLRDATPADRDTIARITREAYAGYRDVMTPGAWAALSRAVEMGLAAEGEGVQRIVAEREGRIVGCVMLFPPASEAYGDMTGRASWVELRLLAVAPEARGAGVGRALVEECAHRAHDMGATELGLHTSRSMADASRLYRSMCFERVPEQDFHPEGAELVEAYRLYVGQELPPWGA